MAEYRFLTTWVLDGPRERIWEAIYDSEHWPAWWPGVIEATKLSRGDPSGVGQRGRYAWRAKLPYTVHFEIEVTRVQPHTLLEGAAEGELTGIGRWRFFEQDGVTAVLYEWNVRTTRRWMNLVGPVAGGVFRSNHDHLMAAGGRGLAELLGCRLLASDNA